jgi:hypothetical protein
VADKQFYTASEFVIELRKLGISVTARTINNWVRTRGYGIRFGGRFLIPASRLNELTNESAPAVAALPA